MATRMKLAAGATVPPMALAKAGGGEVKIGGGGKWQLFIVYRGKHCPICRTYLKGLDGMLDDIRAADIDLVVASGDTREKAETEVKEEGWRFPVGYGMTLDQMRALGLYISHPRTPPDTDCDFPEPGMFVINPEGKAQVIDVSNAPFARPDLKMVVNGIKMTRERGFPVRGTAD